jgi:hypothetical protein
VTTSDAVRAVLLDRCIEEGPLELREGAAASRCQPVRIRSRRPHWALRLRDGDHLPILAELSKEQSLRRLPDYVVFGQVDPASGDTGLRVLICELKSSAPKGGTRPGRVEPASRYDKLTKMRVFEVRDGGEIRLEDFF